MKLIKEIAFASALTLASLVAMPSAFAHEIKFGDLVISHPWSRQSPMGADVPPPASSRSRTTARPMTSSCPAPPRSLPSCRSTT